MTPSTRSAQEGRMRSDGDGALLATGERLVERALARGADQAECYVEEERSLGVELEGGRISVTSADHSIGVGLRVVKGGRLGFASASGTASPADGRVVDAALRLADRSPATGYSLPAPQGAAQAFQAWDDEVAAADPAFVLRLAEGLLTSWKDVAPDARLPGGGVDVESARVAIASSQGIACEEAQTGLSMAVSLVQEGSVTVNAWESRGSHRADVEPADVVGRAAKKLQDLLRPEKAPWSGPTDVVLLPEAAGELVGSFIETSCRGDDALRGNTRWSTELGQRVASTSLSAYDDPLAPRAIGGCSHDDEGLATTRRPIIEAGILRTFVFDTFDAHKHGQRATASGQRGGFSSRPGAGIHHLVLDHERRLEDVVADVDRGYLVDTLLGAHTANPTTGEFSVTAPNVWRIEGGAVAGASREIALAGSVPDLLGSVRALSKQEKQMSGARMPAMAVSGVQVAT